MAERGRFQSWVLARDDELLYGHDASSKTWGGVLIPDDDVVKDYLLARVEELERAVDELREAVVKSDAKYHFLLDKKKGKEARYNWPEGMTEHDKSMT